MIVISALQVLYEEYGNTPRSDFFSLVQVQNIPVSEQYTS